MTTQDAAAARLEALDTTRLLEEARREVGVLSERLSLVVKLIDRAIASERAAPARRAFRTGRAVRGGDDAHAVEGAQLVALNMALAGRKREDARRWLAAVHFDDGESARILDDVFGSG